MSIPLVSVILPTRNRPALLPRALASILAQSELSVEIIVVDNNTDEATLDRSASSLLSDPRVRVVRAAGARNAAVARNVGLDAALGAWVTYLDDDDEYTPGKIFRQLMRANESGCNFVLCGAEVLLNGRKRLVQCDNKSLSGDQLLNKAISGAPLLLHRNGTDMRFDETLSAGEDAVFGQQLLAYWDMGEAPVVAEPLVIVHQEGPVRPRTNLQAQASWRAARRLWWQFGLRYSPGARRIFVLRALVAREKISGRFSGCASAGCRLLRASGASQMRYVANALMVAAGLGRGRFVT